MNSEQQDLDQLRGVLGLAAPDRVTDGPGSFVAATRVLERGGEHLWVLRARPGLARAPFEGLSAAAAMAPAGVPIAPHHRVEPPVVSVSSAVRGVPPGVPGTALLAGRPDGRALVYGALGRVLGALAATPALTCSLHAEGGRFLAAPSWRAAVEGELAKLGRALASAPLDLGALEGRLLARARDFLAGSPEPADPSLLHGALSEGHLRFDPQGALLEVTGWEFAGTGDPLADVGGQLLLDPPDWELVRAALPAGWDDGPAVPERLGLGAALAALRTLATVAASLPSLPPADRAQWHERCRLLADRALAVVPAERLAGRPLPPTAPPSPDRVWLFRIAAAIGARPAPLASDALPLAAALAVLELRDDAHRALAHDRAGQLLARFDARAPGAGGEPLALGPALAAIDALRPEGRGLALVAGRVVRALDQALGPAMPSSARAASVEWLAAAAARVEPADDPAAELLEVAFASWARPEARDALRPLARAAFEALPPGPVPERTARFLALAVASVEPRVPLLARGLAALGFSDEEVRRAFPPCCPRVDWGAPPA